MRRVVSVLFIAFVLAATPRAASADLISIRFDATITSSGVEALLPLGGSASWVLTYDTAAPAQSSGDAFATYYGGFYSETLNLSLDVAGFTDEWTSPHANINWNRTSFVGPLLAFDNSLFASSSSGTVGFIPGYAVNYFDFSAFWPTAAPFASTTLPSTLPTSPVSGGFSMMLCASSDGQCFDSPLSFVSGDLTSVRAVPEPATSLLIGVGALVFTGRRALKTRRNGSSRTPRLE